MKKVLIITYNFPPINDIASRRFGDICKHMAKFGWKPFILTTNSIGPLEIPLSENCIIRVGSHYQNNKMATNNNNSSNNLLTKINNFRLKNGFYLRTLDSTYSTWYKKVKKLNINELQKHNFDFIITSFGPSAALYIGKYLSKKLKVPLIVDFRDLASLYKDKYNNKNIIFTLLDLFIEKRLLNNIIGITTVSNGLKKEIERHYEVPIQVIYNGWENPIYNKNNFLKPNFKQPYIYYAGRFYQHQMDSIFILMEAISVFEINLVIRSLGPEDINKKILLFAQKKGIQNKVILLPPAEPHIIEEESKVAMINLVLEDLDQTIGWKKGVLTGKFLPLLIKEPPILAIARKDSEIGNILNDTKKGELHSNVFEVRNFIERILLDSSEYSGNKDIIISFSKEMQAKKLCSFLDELLIN